MLSRVACCPELAVQHVIFLSTGAICGQLANEKRMLSRVACCPELLVPNIVFFSNVLRQGVYFRCALFADSMPTENVRRRGWRAVLNWLSDQGSGLA